MITRRTVIAAGGLTLAGAPRILARVPDRLGELGQATFRFFWDTTDARTGMAPDRWPSPSNASIAAVGFALSAYPIGVARGWVGRAAARDRTLATLRYLWRLPQGPGAQGTAGYRGFFYHFLTMPGGVRAGRCELSTVDTALLMAGVLFAGAWFDRLDPAEAEIRSLSRRLYERVEWDWAADRTAAGDPRPTMGWHPETGFLARRWNGYTEAMLLYLLAMGSPSHPLPPTAWAAWCATYPDSWRGQGAGLHLAGAPQFWHQYSHCWIDFRGIRDAAMRAAGLDYFENSRRATAAQRAYATANPGGFAGYGADLWGLTACDGPGGDLIVPGFKRDRRGYSARGPVHLPDGYDDGTIAPTAAAASIAFAPEAAARAVAGMRQRYGAAIWGRYGFADSFNPSLAAATGRSADGRVVPGLCWVANDRLGIDQGPILLMAENARSGLVWDAMRGQPDLARGLKAAGFEGVGSGGGATA